MPLFIGLISGTSADAVDAALVEFAHDQCDLKSYLEYPYPTAVTKQIHQIQSSRVSLELAQLSILNVRLGRLFANAANTLIENAGIDKQDIVAIGSHGQTLFHLITDDYSYSTQAADPNTIAALTGLTTIADFRNMDIAYGGQGAPLAPGFHQALFRSTPTNRVILNLGGIANITFLPADREEDTIGFDTGPANSLMDAWIQENKKQPFDMNGQWGKSGNLIPDFLEQLLLDPYFQRPYPKSTGREYFNLEWLSQYLLQQHIKAEDVQATLHHLTVESVAGAVENLQIDCDEIIVCGGGAHNHYLLELLEKRMKKTDLVSSDYYDIDPDCVEAMAFAWLAKRRLESLPGNICSVTGAEKDVILGAIYTPT